MSFNCLSYINDSLPADLSTTFHVVCRLFHCFNSRTGAYITNVFIFTNVFLMLPLCVFILNLGLKQWRQQGSSRRMSHSDLFTYHMVMMELINIFGFTITFCGLQAKVKEMTMVGIAIMPIDFSGQLMFHTFTCIERYLATVYPITYMSLKNTNGIRARNVLIVCVWLLSLSVILLISLTGSTFITILSYCLVPTAMISMAFCSISILCALINPKPGSGGKDTKSVSPMKLRALCTVMVILGVLLFRFGGNVFIGVMNNAGNLDEPGKCSIVLCDFFFSLPCSLVSPLLFLHKTRKLKCC